MFYEQIGLTLGRGGVALRDRQLRGDARDERDQREYRQISLLLRRISSVWPDLFAALNAESAVLARTLEDAKAALPSIELPVEDPDSERDPLEYYRSVNRGLEQAVIALHAHHEEAWASGALRRLRRGLAEAAEIQGRLIDAALAV